MVKTSAIVVMPSAGALAKADAGLALINSALDADVVQAMVDADRFRREVQQATYLGEGEISPSLLARAKPLHRLWLPNFTHADWCFSALFQLACMPPLVPLTQAAASRMLNYLFAAMGKRRGEEAAAKLLACTDVFSPSSNALGSALGLWEPAPSHPALLAIAIKQLMAEKTFEPAESELREALAKVQQRVSTRAAWVDQWLEKAARADEIVFAFDRHAWAAAHASCGDSKVAIAIAMRERLFEEPSADDKPSARWHALNDLATPPEPLRQAACATSSARRTRKPHERGRKR